MRCSHPISKHMVQISSFSPPKTIVTIKCVRQILYFKEERLISYQNIMKFGVSLEYLAFWLWAASRGVATPYDKTSIKHVSSCIEMDSTLRQAKTKNRIKTKPVKPVRIDCIAIKIDSKLDYFFILSSSS